MRFKIDWASLTVGRKFTVFALFYFVFEESLRAISKDKSPGGLYLEGRFNGGFFALRFPEFHGIFSNGHYQQAYVKLNPQRLAENVVSLRRHISIFHTFCLQKMPSLL